MMLILRVTFVVGVNVSVSIAFTIAMILILKQFD